LILRVEIICKLCYLIEESRGKKLVNADRLYEGLNANERCGLYANALNKSLEIFVSYTEKEVDNILSNGLRPAAAAAGLDRIIVFRISNREAMLCGEKYRWDRIIGGTAPIDDVLRELPVTSAIRRWVSIVSNDECISLKRSEFKEDEAAFLSPRGVMSILIVPVFTEGEFWGVVTCHDNTEERDFDEDCVAMLCSTARICVSTIIRAEKTKSANQAVEALRRREEMSDILNKVSVIFLSENEEKVEDTMAAGVRLIADMVEIDRLILCRNHIAADNLHASEVYRWDRSSGGSTEVNAVFVDVSYARLIPDWEGHLSGGNHINSPSKLMSENAATALQSWGVLTAAVIPIHINTIFWGFALFGDTRNERYFKDDIIEMLRSAAFLFANAFIRAEVDYDALTGIHNRRFFDESMKRIINFLSRSCGLLSLLMIDIDFFKRYNDTYGHIEGDKCLKIVAQTLSRSITRADDFVVRYGGEEFVLVLPNTDKRGAQLIAHKLLDNIRNCNIPHEQNDAAKCLTISIGATTGKVAHTHNADDFVKKADELLYKSKQSGRNRCSFEQL
jgi:diguanylate cyclase (GGDEF)-like protein